MDEPVPAGGVWMMIDAVDGTALGKWALQSDGAVLLANCL